MHESLIADAERDLGCALGWAGDLELLRRPRCALLLSRGERAPRPSSPVPNAAIDAAREIAARGETLVCGAGRVLWDAALLACREAHGSALVALAQGPLEEIEHRELRDFLPRETLLIWPQIKRAKSLSPDMLLLRDRLVGRFSEKALAIQLRANGNMAALKAEMLARGCVIDERAVAKCEPGINQRLTPHPGPLPLKESGGTAASFDGRLTHFTRASDGAWPGESRVDYLRWLCSGELGERESPRDDFHALRRILSERKLRACGRLIAGKAPMVCFTAANPSELLQRKIWRKGLRRWTVSPYAISFPAEMLRRRGARPVRYIESAVSDYGDEPCFKQPASSVGQNWEFEAEWRLRGDFDFSQIEAKDIVALVAASWEAESLACEFGIASVVAQ